MFDITIFFMIFLVVWLISLAAWKVMPMIVRMIWGGIGFWAAIATFMIIGMGFETPMYIYCRVLKFVTTCYVIIYSVLCIIYYNIMKSAGRK